MRHAILLAVALFAAACTSIPAPTLQPFEDGNDWLLTSPLVYRVGTTGEKIIVPAGFVTDLASVPRGLCTLLSSTDRYMRAAIVHDFLYWDQTCTKKQADKTLLAAMIEANVAPWKRTAVYLGVDVGGGGAWASNAEDRRNRLIRVIPKQHRNIPSGVTWFQYRRQLAANRVVEAPYARPTPAACMAYQQITP